MPASGVIWTADGLVVTAHHVVKSSNLTVHLPEGRTVSATLVGRDPTTDLALVRVDASDLQPANWDDAELQVGNLVLALARPGRSVQATLGVVSALGGSWRTGAGGEIDRYLQTDVLMYPGFSGGPLVTASGQFAGINSSALRRGASLTIPATTVRRVAEALLAHGRVQRGYLGVSTQPVRLPAGLREEIGQETGLLIVAVETDSPAESGGLVLGDTIVALDGQVVRHHDDLVRLLSGERVGQKVPVAIVRGGQQQTVNLTIGERS
jgi:S1-C subfamily serine protease